MKDKPILFSAPMVQALLDGRKTQTRRILKGTTEHKGQYSSAYIEAYKNRDGWKKICPYGKPGDLLWVRESWRIGAWRSEWIDTNTRYMSEGAQMAERHKIAVDYRASPEIVRTPWNTIWGESKIIDQSWEDCKKSGLQPDDDGYTWEHGKSPCRWRSSIHMFKWASRLTLEITNIRVERLQNIKHGDAIAEGIYCYEHNWHESEYYLADWAYEPYDGFGHRWSEADYAYRALWESINGKDSWESNPWLWVIEFKVHKQNIDEFLK